VSGFITAERADDVHLRDENAVAIYRLLWRGFDARFSHGAESLVMQCPSEQGRCVDFCRRGRVGKSCTSRWES
jgi:hypothetical protein